MTTFTDKATADLRRFLETVTAARKLTYAGRCRFPYLCIEDFVLRHGQAFRERVSPPKGLWPGIANACFQNSAILATVCPERWTYVEGYAVGIIPVHHAWVIDEEGRVLDITWPEAMQPECPPAYFGVAFNTRYVKRTVMGGIGCCLDNYQERFPLLTGAHSLEQALHRPEGEGGK